MSAKTNREVIQEVALVPPEAGAVVEKIPKETVYTVQELAVAHQEQFGCSYEVVRAAFLHAGKDRATLADAKDMVERFRKREVK